MPDVTPDENPWVRVTQKGTGHHLTIRESAVAHGDYTVLKQDAVGVDGEPLPPEFKSVESTGQAATTKEKD